MNNSSVYSFRKYDLTLTTCIGAKHGMSGHIFELIEYFYYFRFWHNLNCNIFIPFKFKECDFKRCLDKYDFSDFEKQVYLDNLQIAENPKIIDANTCVFVDGAMHYKTFKGLYKVNKKIFLRCSDTETLEKADVILQDNRIYDELPNSVHYVKKILFNKFKKIDTCENNALIYATRNCRHVTKEYLESLLKYDLKHYIVLSDEELEMPENFELIKVPCENLFELFKTYIYTPLQGDACKMIDCSPRFIAECKFYNKDIIYDVPYFYKGLDVRKYDIENNFNKLFLEKDDKIIDFL